MDFGFSEEQDMLRAEVRKFLDRNAPLTVVRELAATPEGCDRSLWGQMAELGWVGLTIPEPYGGTGLDLVTSIVLLEETGRLASLRRRARAEAVLRSLLHRYGTWGTDRIGGPDVIRERLEDERTASIFGLHAVLSSEIEGAN